MSARDKVWRTTRGFFLFWWDFIVGEDVTIAVGCALGLAAVYLFHRHDVSAWWMLPVLWVVALLASLTRAVRKAKSAA